MKKESRKVIIAGRVDIFERQIIGRTLSNGLVKDMSGAKVIARLVRGGLVVGYGCRNIGFLEKDGKIRKGNQEFDYKIMPSGVVVDTSNQYVGEVIQPGPAFDNNCTLIGEIGNDGIVRTAGGDYVGCVNPDGTV